MLYPSSVEEFLSYSAHAVGMYSPAIIRNLEAAWDPKRRGGVK